MKKLTLRDNNPTETDKTGLQPWTAVSFTVAALFCRFLSGCCLAKSTFSRSISLAVCVTVYFWLIRSLVDHTSTDSIIVRGPLQLLNTIRLWGVSTSIEVP